MVPGGAIVKLALATMRCVRFTQGDAGYPLRGTVDGVKC